MAYHDVQCISVYRYVECMLARKPSECTNSAPSVDEQNELKDLRIWSHIITCCAVGGAILLYYLGEMRLAFTSTQNSLAYCNLIDQTILTRDCC